MDLIKAAVLGMMQGATEFLPISSSGHLVLVPWWLGWDEPSLLFDVMVHMGTLLAVLVYFWRDWLTLLRAGWTALRTRSLQDPDARLLVWLIVGTIPAAVIGALFQDFFESRVSDIPSVAVELIITGAILVWAERLHRAQESVHEDSDSTASNEAFYQVGLLGTILIGIAQAVAILPGISRSGSTIAVGMWRGLPRAAAARFSFLLGTPIIAGTGAKKVLDVLTGSETVANDMIAPLGVGFVASTVVGFLSIWFLLRLLQQRRLYGFAVYCAGFGALSLLVALF